MASQSRQTEMLAIFHKYGGAIGLNRFTHYCIEEGVWTEDERQRMVFSKCREECGKVLKTHDQTGLPIAGRTNKQAEGEPLWIQRELWDLDDARVNLGRRLCGAEKDWQVIHRLHAYIEDRYGTSLPMPRLVMPPDEDQWWHTLADEEDDLV